ncbi:MAG: zinc ribbon domain-containing protein [Chitinispirillaceae bacterium]|nr:zinc ribbon domain-containing protein [Chitinispirillaceae bacterium]
MSADTNTSICPHCGGEIRMNARSCPHCGSDEQTGWSSKTYLDEVGLPDDTSYEEIRLKEFGNGSSRHRMSRRRLLFIVVASIVTAVFVAGTLTFFR